MKHVSDLLSQKATIEVREDAVDSAGQEKLGALTRIHTDIPCLVCPMGAERASWHGLDIRQRPVEILFEHDRLITEDRDGQAYQMVHVTVDNATTYTVQAPQVVFGEGLDTDDIRHIAVPAVRREDGGG
ncbi:MAG TPA: hypothetical protein VM223_23820 [Planctomycetota bacterium]|nr:hypothetical protein [Planctomycetota bacterium]